MPLSFPSSPTINQQYSDANGVVWKYNGFAWEPYLGSSYRAFIGAKVLLNSTLNLSASLSAISWGAEEFNIGGLFSSSTPTRFYARGSGYYRIHVDIFTGTYSAGNSYSICIRKNNITNIVEDIAGANQSVFYDEIIYLENGDYIEILASESTASGSITTDTIAEINFVGASASTSVFNNYNLFSGAKLQLNSNENLTNSNTAIPWGAAIFNINADASGNVYWNSGQSSNVKIYTDGYYRIQMFIATESTGSINSYTVNLRKNNTSTIETSTLSPNDFLIYDEIVELNNTDYLQVEASESSSSGAIKQNSYITITRVGI